MQFLLKYNSILHVYPYLSLCIKSNKNKSETRTSNLQLLKDNRGTTFEVTGRDKDFLHHILIAQEILLRISK